MKLGARLAIFVVFVAEFDLDPVPAGLHHPNREGDLLLGQAGNSREIVGACSLMAFSRSSGRRGYGGLNA